MTAMTLTEFLLARIAEDEAAAERAGSFTPWSETFQNDNYGHLTIQPDRVLAECEAKRRIVELHMPFHVTTRNDGLDWDYWGCGACEEPEDWKPEHGGGWWPCSTLRLLALPYADHPDYDVTWCP